MDRRPPGDDIRHEGRGCERRPWRDPTAGWRCLFMDRTGNDVSYIQHNLHQTTQHNSAELIFDASKRHSSANSDRRPLGHRSALTCLPITFQEYMNVSAQEHDVASLAGCGAAFGLWGWGKRRRRRNGGIQQSKYIFGDHLTERCDRRCQYDDGNSDRPDDNV